MEIYWGIGINKMFIANLLSVILKMYINMVAHVRENMLNP